MTQVRIDPRVVGVTDAQKQIVFYVDYKDHSGVWVNHSWSSDYNEALEASKQIRKNTRKQHAANNN